MIDRDKWDAVRYVLVDPTLDRSVFESRMLEDLELALLVADTVRQTELLRKATAEFHSIQFQANQKGWHWSKIAVLAAAMLLAIGVGSFQIASMTDRTSMTVAKSMFDGKNAIADQWLAFSGDAVGLDPSGDGLAEDIREAHVAGEGDVEEEDWMLEAARDYFAEGVAS
jgi:hypothetical protein